MGYRITYKRGIMEKKTFRDRRIKWKSVAVTLLVLCLVGALAFPGGRLWLRDILLPGDADITAAALGSLVENLSAGEPVGEAVQTFCREIIHGDRT